MIMSICHELVVNLRLLVYRGHSSCYMYDLWIFDMVLPDRDLGLVVDYTGLRFLITSHVHYFQVPNIH